MQNQLKNHCISISDSLIRFSKCFSFKLFRWTAENKQGIQPLQTLDFKSHFSVKSSFPCFQFTVFIFFMEFEEMTAYAEFVSKKKYRLLDQISWIEYTKFSEVFHDLWL